MSEAHIRPALEADVEAIHRVLTEAAQWLESRGIPMWLPEELQLEDLREQVRSGMFVVAESGGEIAGTLRFQLDDQEFWPDISAAESAFVHRLAVSRRFAGQGVATALLAWAAERARQLGRSWLRLDCDAHREKLHRFYESFGFRRHSFRQVGPHYVARYELRL